MDRSTAAGKVAALNFLMPYVQRLPNRLLRSEWATRIASELRVDEPVLREELRRAAIERRSEVKPKAALLGSRGEARRAATDSHARRSRRIPRAARARAGRRRAAPRPGERKDPRRANLEGGRESPIPPFWLPRSRKKIAGCLFEILFESSAEPTWEEAESCLSVLRSRRVEQELLRIAAEDRIESIAHRIESPAHPATGAAEKTRATLMWPEHRPESRKWPPSSRPS